MIASYETKPLVLAQIGCGYWGPNLLRNFYALPRTSFLFTTKESIAAPFLGENMDFDNPEGPQFAYRTGDILMPEVKFAEPVRVAEHFLDCIRNSQEPLTGLAHARTVVSILKRARPLSGEVKHGNLTA